MLFPDWAFWLVVSASVAVLAGSVYTAIWYVRDVISTRRYRREQGCDFGPSEPSEPYSSSDLGATGATYVPEWETVISDGPNDYLYLDDGAIRRLYAQTFDAPVATEVETQESNELGGSLGADSVITANVNSRTDSSTRERRSYSERPVELQFKDLVEWFLERGRLIRFNMDNDYTRVALAPIESALNEMKSQRGVSVDARATHTLVMAVARQVAQRAADDLNLLKKRYVVLSGDALIEPGAGDDIRLKFMHVMSKHMRRTIRDTEAETGGAKFPYVTVNDSICVGVDLDSSGMQSRSAKILVPGKRLQLTVIGRVLEVGSDGDAAAGPVTYSVNLAPLVVDVA